MTDELRAEGHPHDLRTTSVIPPNGHERNCMSISNLLKAAVLAIAFCAGNVSLQAQTVRDLDLELGPDEVITLGQALEIAVANNIEMKRAFYSLMDADEQVRIAWSEVLPSISTSANYTRNIEVPINFLPAEFFGGEPGELIPVAFGTDNNWIGGVTVSQNIFRGEAIVGISSSSLFRLAREEGLRATMQQVVTETRKAYYGVLMAREQLRLVESSVNRIQENLEEARSRFGAGLADEYDVLRLEVQLANLQPQIRQAEDEYEQAFRGLKFLMGLPVEMPFRLAGDLFLFDILSEESDSPENMNLKQIDRLTPLPSLQSGEAPEQVGRIMEERRGDLRVLDLEGRLKEREILAIRTRFLPEITADYSMQWISAQPGGPVFFQDAHRYQTLGVTLRFSVFEGFRRRAELNRALIERKEISERRYSAEQAARNEYETAVENLARIFDTASARWRALEQARRGYEIALRREEEGLGSRLEVTEAELQVREAEINYSQMVYDYLVAKADYDFALGLVPLVDRSGAGHESVSVPADNRSR